MTVIVPSDYRQCRRRCRMLKRSPFGLLALVLCVTIICYISAGSTTTSKQRQNLFAVAAEVVTETTTTGETPATATEKESTTSKNNNNDDGKAEKVITATAYSLPPEETTTKKGSGKGDESDKTTTGVIELTSKNFDQLVLGGEDEIWLIEFYAPWCSHCQRLEPTWNALARELHSSSTKVKVAKVDGQADRTLASRFHIRGYPSIYRIEGRYDVREFQDRSRTLENFKTFALDSKDYNLVDPVSFWTASPFGPVGMTKAYVMMLGNFLIESYTYMDQQGYSKVTMGAICLFGILIVSFCMVMCIGFCLIPNDDEKEKYD